MNKTNRPPRPGELALPFDPADHTEAGLAFIGRLRTPWAPGDCPRNLRQARERGGRFRAELAPAYRQGLQGLSVGQAVILLYWMHGARRDLIVQNPSHADAPRGTFALRSPVRPNPVSLATVVVTALDIDTGVVEVDALDCFDGTPLIDIKPWLDTIDVPPAAR